MSKALFTTHNKMEQLQKIIFIFPEDLSSLLNMKKKDNPNQEKKIINPNM